MGRREIQTLKILEEHIFEYFYKLGASVCVFLSMSRKYEMVEGAFIIVII